MTVTVEQLVKGFAALAAAVVLLVALPMSFGASLLFLLIVCALGFGIREARSHGHFRLYEHDRAPAHEPTQFAGQIIVRPTKSVAASLLLTIFFGPFGLLYSSVLGGLLMLIFGGLLALVTFGFGLLLIWPLCIVWGVVATNSHNRRLMRRLR